MRTALLFVALFAFTASGDQRAVDALHAKTGGAPSDALDKLCAQKDCHASRLFWHTDLEEAKAAARAEGKRILSLYMLGRLDEELSCANSRFFRVMLYSDPAISAVMRDRFVLHWHSVRPVPIVTIDMGDGRTIRQTITGNSVHYLLDADGNVLDALPGLNAPNAFLAQLEEWANADRQQIEHYHRTRATAATSRSVASPTAVDASRRAVGKALVEAPVLRKLSLGARVPEFQVDGINTDIEFSAESLALMRTKQPLSEKQLMRVRTALFLDTELNAGLHGIIHRWFALGEVKDLASLNERIYAELFLTPSSDPWLGLDPDAAFAAL